MTQKVFAQLTGISEGSLSGVFNGRTKPTLSMVDSIHQSLPKVSVYWLLYGDGPMYVDDSTAKSNSAQPSSPTGEGTGAPATAASQGPSGALGSPSLFDRSGAAAPSSASRTTNHSSPSVIKYIDKPERHITEIRVFYDDQTWETFVPKK